MNLHDNQQSNLENNTTARRSTPTLFIQKNTSLDLSNIEVSTIQFRGLELNNAYNQLAQLINNHAAHYEYIADIPETHREDLFPKILSGGLCAIGALMLLTPASKLGIAFIIGGLILSRVPAIMIPNYDFIQRCQELVISKVDFIRNFKDPIGVGDSKKLSYSQIASLYLLSSTAIGCTENVQKEINHTNIHKALSILDLGITKEDQHIKDLVATEEFRGSLKLLRKIARVMTNASYFVVNGFSWDADNYRKELTELIQQAK